MSQADEIARVREIKSLLHRIQHLRLGEGASDTDGQWPSAELEPGNSPGRGPGPSISPWLFVMATALNTIVTAVLAVLITLGVVNREPPRNSEQAAISPAGRRANGPDITTTGALFTQARDPAEAVTTRPIELLPVGSAEQPLRLVPLKPSRLPLQIRPEEALQETFILILSGLPANATLSGASRMSSDSWLLPPGSLSRLEIVLAEWSPSLIQVGMELRRTNGVVATQSNAWLAAPPPHGTPTAGQADPTAIKELLASGDRLLSRGDVAAARAVYERAAALGSGLAALTLGATYDPSRLWSLGVFGMVGSKERARHWYARADQLGHPEAKDRLKAIKIKE